MKTVLNALEFFLTLVYDIILVESILVVHIDIQ